MLRASLVAALLLAGVALAQPNPADLLNKTKADQAILTQRVEGRLREAIAEARKLQAVSPVRAANALKTALIQLDDPLIPAGFRNDWTAQLNAQIKFVESGTKLPDPTAVNTVKQEVKEADLKRAKAIQEEYTDVRRSIDTISTLMKSGNSAQAQREADALSKKYPDNPAAIEMLQGSTMSQRVTDARVLVQQQEQGYLLAMRSVDKSAIMPKDDIEFNPEYFREITKKRMKPLLTKKEQELMRSLDTEINLGFKNSPFEEVMKAISTGIGQEILLDKQSLDAAMVNSNTLTSVNVRSVTARTALRKVLQENGLTYIIKNETIQVVTLDRAREQLVTRVYYLGDLISVNGPFSGVKWGPNLNFAQMQENAMRLMETIKAIDPDSWKERGGSGTATFNWPSMAVIVRQTAEVHARMGASLGR